MPAWWSWLTSSRKRIIVAGAAVVLLVIVSVGVTWASSGQIKTPLATPSAEPTNSTSADVKKPSQSPKSEATPTPTLPDPTALPPDADEYCPAFAAIKKGGPQLEGSGDEDENMNLASLSRMFDQLITKYSRAEKVAPVSLRDDYGRTLNYLRQSKAAADSGDEDLLLALATNLDSLNESMEAIVSGSERFCS